MRHNSRITAVLIFGLVACLTAVAAGPAPEQVILQYLDHTIDWERAVTA